MEAVAAEKVLEKIESLSDGDRASRRTNPFAISKSTGNLVTADEIAVCDATEHLCGFACPSCSADLRHQTSQLGNPYFSHVGARGNCESGRESAAHMCIKLGLRSIGLLCEYWDKSLRLKYDAFDPVSGQAVEVVCTGRNRYFKKLEATAAAGQHVNWIFDSAAKGLATADGAEQLVHDGCRSGTLITRGFFVPKTHELLRRIPEDRQFLFYRGLIWRAVGLDAWELLNESHPFNEAATRDNGIKHLMVLMHHKNSQTVTENERRGVYRSTWYDRTWRYRGQKQKPSAFNLTWGKDREYLEETIAKLVSDIAFARERTSRRGRGPGNSVPSEPKHATADEIVRKVTQSHSLAISEVNELRRIVDKASSNHSSDCINLGATVASPMVLASASGSRASASDGYACHTSTLVARVASEPVANQLRGECRDGWNHKTIVRQCGCIEWPECIRCGARGMSSVIDRRKSARR